MKYNEDSFGIYEKGSFYRWAKQREGIAKRLDKFYKGIGAMQAMVKIIEKAKKNNPNNLPF
jgi:hypothetical protein